jgi:peptide/nickel transport system permease protein
LRRNSGQIREEEGQIPSEMSAHECDRALDAGGFPAGRTPGVDCVIKYIIRRLCYSAIIVFAILTIAFFILRVIPGDPVVSMMGLLTPQSVIEQMRSDLGLNKPIPEQYVHYLKGILAGDLGESLRQRQPVFPLILKSLVKTFQLSILAIGLATMIAFVLGISSALYRGSALDRIVLFLLMAGQSTPNFWLGTMLVLVFSVNMKLLPALGYKGPESLILPAITLAVGLFPILARYIRSSVSSILRDEFILCLRSRGLSESVIYRHILKNISVPLITIISQQSGYLLAGAFIVESVFNYPGVGFLGIVAAANRDFPLLQGIVVVVSAMFVLINLIIDLAYAVIDPRIRYT